MIRVNPYHFRDNTYLLRVNPYNLQINVHLLRVNAYLSSVTLNTIKSLADVINLCSAAYVRSKVFFLIAQPKAKLGIKGSHCKWCNARLLSRFDSRVKN
ncbi:hypothetical protein Avbf_08248 [Armadillidium vulgare]|nr:hypothetical protein Avbf_08248 [Armadillidium vulgare]